MFRAVVLAATLLLASLGMVGQSNSTPSAGRNSTAQANAPVQNPTPPANSTSSTPATAEHSAATRAAGKAIQSATEGQDPRTATSAELPQTSTILPLLGLLGLGSLVAGLFARR
jgi:hypothetical protein